MNTIVTLGNDSLQYSTYNNIIVDEDFTERLCGYPGQFLGKIMASYLQGNGFTWSLSLLGSCLLPSSQ